MTSITVLIFNCSINRWRTLFLKFFIKYDKLYKKLYQIIISKIKMKFLNKKENYFNTTMRGRIFRKRTKVLKSLTVACIMWRFRRNFNFWIFEFCILYLFFGHFRRSFQGLFISLINDVRPLFCTFSNRTPSQNIVKIISG